MDPTSARTMRIVTAPCWIVSREEADFFTASVLGLFVMLRAKAPQTVIESAARAAIQHLEALT